VRKWWCPRCKVIVTEPSTYEWTKYVKFWRDNRCFRCETQLSNLPSAEKSESLKNPSKPKAIIECPRCEYTFEEPDIMSPSAAWVYYQQGLCPHGVRAWKSFDWEAMNRLHEKGYISNPVGKAKPIIFTEK
jgi:hypothetical protein